MALFVINMSHVDRLFMCLCGLGVSLVMIIIIPTISSSLKLLIYTPHFPQNFSNSHGGINPVGIPCIRQFS